MVSVTFLLPYYQTGKRCWLGLCRRGFCLCVRVCPCLSVSLSLWDLPVGKRLRTVGLSSIFCSGYLTTVLHPKSSQDPSQQRQANACGSDTTKDSGKHLSMYYESTPFQESPRLSVFLSGGFPSRLPSKTEIACAKATTGHLPLAPRAGLRAAVAAAWWSQCFCCCFPATVLPEQPAASLPLLCQSTSLPFLPLFCWFGLELGFFFGMFSFLLPISMLTAPVLLALSNQSLH